MYEWKKTVEKFGKAAVFVIIAGIAARYGNSAMYLAIAPMLAAIENYLKHRND